MKLTIPRIDLLQLIGVLQAIVPSKPALPILSNILIESREDQLILIATDLTVSMRVLGHARIEEQGSIALPGRKFFQLVRELTAPIVEISTSHRSIAIISSGTSHFRMSGMSKEEFPSFSEKEGGITLTIATKQLKEMLVRTSFAAARDDNRQSLNGIFFQHRGRRATLVGTDGKRLARLSIDLDDKVDGEGSYILPLKATEEMIKLLEIPDDQVQLSFFFDKVILDTGTTILITKLLNGNYPDVDQVIPKRAEQPLLIHREELISLLKQVALFTSDHSSAVRLSFNPGELHLTASNLEIGEGKAVMALNYSGPQLNIAFNPYYLIDILRHIKDESIELSLSDGYNPGLITDSTQAEFVLMPMRIE